MKHYDVFKSEGGFRVALGIHNDCPVINASPWFATKKEALNFVNDNKAANETQYKKDSEMRQLLGLPTDDDYKNSWLENN